MVKLLVHSLRKTWHFYPSVDGRDLRVVQRNLEPVSVLSLPFTLKTHWVRACQLLCVCRVFNIIGTETLAAEKT